MLKMFPISFAILLYYTTIHFSSRNCTQVNLFIFDSFSSHNQFLFCILPSELNVTLAVLLVDIMVVFLRYLHYVMGIIVILLTIHKWMLIVLQITLINKAFTPLLPLVHLQILSPLPSKPTSNMFKMETVLQMPSHTPAGWKARCAEYFPYSIHFGGKKTSVVALALNNSMLNASENGTLNQEPERRDSSLNGKLQALAIK